MSVPLSLSVDRTEHFAKRMESYVQTLRARAQRIDKVRTLLETLSHDECVGLLCETLGITENDLMRVLEAGAHALSAAETNAQMATADIADEGAL